MMTPNAPSSQPLFYNEVEPDRPHMELNAAAAMKDWEEEDPAWSIDKQPHRSLTAASDTAGQQDQVN